MEFMLLFIDRKDARSGPPAGLAELEKLAGELMSRGALKRALLLGPESSGARVSCQSGRPLVTDGPFAESREVLGGFWIVDAASRDEAIALARRAFETGEPRPHARSGYVEVHCAQRRLVFDHAGADPRFVFAFLVGPELDDADGAKLAEMVEFGKGLEAEKKLLEVAPLDREPRPARIESRAGKTFVSDGPFAEAKELVGGYAVLRLPDRGAAVALAKTYPHARWGSVEIREIA